MRLIPLLIAAALAAGCTEVKKPEPYVPPPVPKFDETKDPHIIVWEGGHDTGRVVIELKNMKKWSLESQCPQPQKTDDGKLIWKGMIWGGPKDLGYGFGEGPQPFIIHCDGKYLYYSGGREGFASFYKEDRYQPKK